MLKKITASADGEALPKSKLAAFIEACLDPLPTAVLVDTAYNSQMRKMRFAKWRKAEATTTSYHAAIQLHHAFHSFAIRDKSPAGLEAVRSSLWSIDVSTLVAKWRQAVADQIQTPAFDQASVQWKRQAAKKPYLPISGEQIEAAIAADVAWLAAHPSRKEPRRARAKRSVA